MNFGIELNAKPAAQKFVKECTDQGESWKFKHTDGITLAIGCIRLFRDKSQILQNARSLVFYPLYTLLLNFLKESRRRHINEIKLFVSIF